ncbi:hypothetical protein [Cytobacillus firmus]
MEQLTLFESEEVSPLSKEDMVYQIGDDVKVRKVQENEPLDPEDFYYLKDFSNKKALSFPLKQILRGRNAMRLALTET